MEHINKVVAGMALAVILFEVGEVGADFAHRKTQTAGHPPVEDQEIGDAYGGDVPLGQPAVGPRAGDRAQDCLPLNVVEARPDLRNRGQQDVVFHVKDACGVVGAFKKGAQAAEIKDVVAQHGAVHGPAHESGVLPDDGQHIRQVFGGNGAGEGVFEADVGVVDGLPNLAGEGGAGQPSVLPRA